MIDGLYEQIIARAQGRCECCGEPLRGRGEVDHFFSRRHSESLETCWLLSTSHHYEKTRNHPTVSVWLSKFIVFAERHGYAEAATRARARLFFADTRRSFARGLTR